MAFAAKPPVPHLRYDSPYGGHPILRKRGADAVRAVESFLRTCTNWNEQWETGTASMWGADKYIVAHPRHDEISQSLSERLGQPKPGMICNAFDETAIESGNPFTQTNRACDWTIPPEHQPWALDLVLSAPPAKRGWPDAISAHWSFEFELRDPRTGRNLTRDGATVLGGQPIRSSIMLFASSGNTSAHFHLLFPFPEPDADFIDVMRAMRPHMPVRIAKSGFRILRLNKRGDNYTIRKFPTAILAMI